MANSSKYLQQLKTAGLVGASRYSQRIRYRLSDDGVIDATRDLRILAEAHLDQVGGGIWVSSYLRSRDALEPVPASELLACAW